jgi:hypothetical protein
MRGVLPTSYKTIAAQTESLSMSKMSSVETAVFFEKKDMQIV